MNYEQLSASIPPIVKMFAGNNDVFHSQEDYYLSYTKPNVFIQELDKKIFGEHGALGNPETAICIKDPWKCLILYGDHREQMKLIAHDLGALKNYWLENQSLVGHSSDSL